MDVAGGPSAELLPVTAFASYNPEFPLGGNDGALWQGKGLNLSLTGGLKGAWGPVSWRVQPEMDSSQNLDYATLNGPGDYWFGLDRVQAYANGTVVHWDWGQSEIRLSLYGMTLGFGNTSLVFGEAQRQHVARSNNAGGFPHLDWGTAQPWKTDWGTFNGSLVWGALYDSTLYTQQDWGGASDWRFFHSLTLGYAPPFWPEFTISATRVFYSPWSTISAFKVFESLVDTVWKNQRGKLSGGVGHEDDVDQLIALSLDLDLKQYGFRAYVEMARNDHSGNWKDFIIQPDHTFGYVAGFKKSFNLSADQSWDVWYEQADLGLNYGTNVRDTGSWYRHSVNAAGYTLGGQLLGASIGPGSNSDYLELGYNWSPHRVFLSYERIANDVDYWVLVVQPASYMSGDILQVYSLGGSTVWQDWAFGLTLGYVTELNRYWVEGNDKTTWRVETKVTWNP